MIAGFSHPLVSTAWLAQHLTDDNLRILDASWYLPAANRNPQDEYHRAHIPGALFCDLDALSDQASPLPHTLPSAEQFGRDMGALGIGQGTMVVVYDTTGFNMSAGRIWWMLRIFGHDRVVVLDGGFGKWRAEGRPVEAGSRSVPAARFIPRPRWKMIRTLDQMKKNLRSGEAQVVDARSAGRFSGTDPEPRPGLRSGHIPGSRNLPYQAVVGPDGTLLPADQLSERFRQAGIDLERPVVASCGSGTSACALLLGLDALGHQRLALYDGSWSEWGSLPDTPIETG